MKCENCSHAEMCRWIDKLEGRDCDFFDGEQGPCTDAVSREAVYSILKEYHIDGEEIESAMDDCQNLTVNGIASDVSLLPSVTQKSGKWIPVSESLPENTYPVNITWVNHDPEPYYADIKDKPFTATGCYCDGKWYWFSVICQDYLDEYRYCDVDSMDEAIEVIAWMPLPKPYEPQESEDKK